jgi:cytochrome c
MHAEVHLVAPLAMLLAATFGSGSSLAAERDEQEPPDDARMIQLAWDSGCFNCHDLDQTVRGPAWRDVAARYRGDPEAFGVLIQRVREGSGGNWGTDRMSPNRRVAVEDIDRLVRWLLALETRSEPAQDGAATTESH